MDIYEHLAALNTLGLLGMALKIRSTTIMESTGIVSLPDQDSGIPSLPSFSTLHGLDLRGKLLLSRLGSVSYLRTI